MKAVLVLEDGSVWPGEGFGAFAKVSGEVVFNTGMVGYPESITDPSYHGQILCQTYPLIGNYGVSSKSFESDKPKIWGYVVSELCETPSHATSEKTLDDWLKENGIPGIAGIDTRALTKKLRVHGVMLGILETYYTKVDLAALRREARLIPDPNKRHLVGEVTAKRIKVYNKDRKKRVVLIDCGVKLNILQSLLRRGVKVVRVPADTPSEKILEYAPDGVVISNGPGDPKQCAATIATVRRLLAAESPDLRHLPGQPDPGPGRRRPTPTSSSSATAARTSPASRRAPSAATSPARTTASPSTSGPCPAAGSPGSATPTTARTRASATSRKPFPSVQFHPEAAPGPTDTEFLFDRFLESLP